MAYRTKASCSWFTAVFLCVLVLVWVAAAPPASYENGCLNGGTPLPTGGCSCNVGFDGPLCELRSIAFDGTGFAVYSPIARSNTTRIRLEVAPDNDTGLVLYVGPYEFDRRYPVQDFMALELRGGVVELVVEYGIGNIFVLESGSCPAGAPQPGSPFTVELVLERDELAMILDDKCRLMSSLARSYRVRNRNPGFLNRDDPLLLGGTAEDAKYLAKLYEWTYTPLRRGFTGCLSNVTVNGQPFELGLPTEWKGVSPGCRVPELSPSRHHYLYWMVGFSLALAGVKFGVMVYRALHPSDVNLAIQMREIAHGEGVWEGAPPRDEDFVIRLPMANGVYHGHAPAVAA